MLIVRILRLAACGFLFAIFTTGLFAQRVAFVFPAESLQNAVIGKQLTDSLSKTHKIINIDLAKSVFQSASFENPFNLSTEEAQNFGKALGCDYFLLLKSENLRRSSFDKPEYYESYLAVYVISARTGRLVYWILKNAEAENSIKAEQKLSALIENTASEISVHISVAAKSEIAEILPDVAELPEENSPDAKNFRSPLPYRRIRPVYTPLANLYNITATVDALVDLDDSGKITRIGITRWAGYGLDESVIKTINEMQWRAASRDGKTLPIRILLRYNFKKVEKEE